MCCGDCNELTQSTPTSRQIAWPTRLWNR